MRKRIKYFVMTVLLSGLAVAAGGCGTNAPSAPTAQETVKEEDGLTVTDKREEISKGDSSNNDDLKDAAAGDVDNTVEDNSAVKTDAPDKADDRTAFHIGVIPTDGDVDDDSYSSDDTYEEEYVVDKVTVRNPGKGYYMSDLVYVGYTSDFEGHSLEEVSVEKNEIIDVEKWLAKNGFIDCRYGTSEGYYIQNHDFNMFRYSSSGDRYPMNLDVYNDSFEMVASYDFSEFIPEGGGSTNYTEPWIHYACTDDTGNILYVSIGHSTYSKEDPETAYIMAIDMNTDEVLWKTVPLVSNSENFVVKGDTIFTGYGFTKEDDYVYCINRITGIIDEKIPVKSAPDFLYEKNGQLYVRTYDRDYVFDIVGYHY